MIPYDKKYNLKTRIFKILNLRVLLFAFFNELRDEERSFGKNTWLMAHSFSAVCAHDVFEQFFRWTLVASVDPSVKTQRNALETTKWRTKMFIPFRLTHAQTKCLCALLGLRDRKKRVLYRKLLLRSVYRIRWPTTVTAKQKVTALQTYN